MTSTTKLDVDILVRKSLRVSASVSGKIEPKLIIAEIGKNIETPSQSAYAFKIGVPGQAPDSIEIQSYDRSGQSLDTRSFHVSEKDDGTATLTFTQDRGKNWILVGIFTDRKWAEAYGDLWKAGVITVDLNAKPKAA